MQKIREQREKNLSMQIEVLEARANNGNISDQLALRKAITSLNWILYREIEEKALFFREWWAGKADRPSPKMFAMLKVKHSANFLPLMKDDLGVRVLSEEENLGFIATHFQNMLNNKGIDKKEQELAINFVDKCRKKSIFPQHSK